MKKMNTPTFSELKKFIDNNKLFYVTFDRHRPNFAQRFNNEFPGLTQYFESLNNEFQPIYSNITELELDQKNLNKKMDSKKIKFYIQTIIGNNFSFINTSNVAENQYELFDVVMCLNYDSINLLNKFLIKKTLPKSQKSFIYNWCVYNKRWNLDNRKMFDKKIDDLIGLDNYFGTINEDIQSYIKHKENLIRIGESTGINYILYGPPGTGKSSFVRALAMHLEIPIYVVKLTAAQTENDITNMLIPQKNKNNNRYDEDWDYNDNNLLKNNLKKIKEDGFKIVLVEDFDRYLKKENGEDTMSSIFNALDGIYPAYGIIRFFSANDPSIISKNSALLSRLNRSFFFDNPNNNQIEKQVYNVFKGKEIIKEKLDKFIDYISKHNLNMRQITHFLCRYLDNDDPMEYILNNMENMIENLKNFAVYTTDTKKVLNNEDDEDLDRF